MNTLERYIFKKMAFSGVGGAVAIFAVVWVSQAVTRIDFATGTGQGIFAFLALLVSISPQLIAIALPFGLLMGMVQTLNQLNGGAELPVMAGSGVSRWSVAKPALLLGAMAAVYTLLSAHFIEPYANQAKRNLIVEARTQLLNTVIVPGQFRRLERDMAIYIDGKDGALLRGLLMADARDPDNQLVYYARNAQMTTIEGNDVLLMEQGQIHRRQQNGTNISIIAFDTYGISLSDFTSSGGAAIYKVIERPTWELLSPDPNDVYMQQRALEAIGEFHRRMTDWLYPVLFALVALVLAGQPSTSRQGRGSALALAFAAGLAYRGAAYYIYGESGGTTATTPWFYIVPVVGITASAYMYHTGMEVRIPDIGIKRLFAKLPRLRPPRAEGI